MTRIQTLIKAILLMLVVMVGLWEAYRWRAMRVFVGPDEVLVVINKFGKSLPPDMIVVPRGHDEYKGVQEDVLGPGRYFINPIEHDWEIKKQVEVSAGDPHR